MKVASIERPPEKPPNSSEVSNHESGKGDQFSEVDSEAATVLVEYNGDPELDRIFTQVDQKVPHDDDDEFSRAPTVVLGTEGVSQLDSKQCEVSQSINTLRSDIMKKVKREIVEEVGKRLKDGICTNCVQTGQYSGSCPLKSSRVMSSKPTEVSSSSATKERVSFISEYSELVRIKAHVNKHAAVVMVDGGSTGDFIDEAYVRSYGISTSMFDIQKSVQLADGTEYNCKSYVVVTVRMGIFSEIRKLSVIPLSGYDVILGIPWLRKHTPEFKWFLCK